MNLFYPNLSRALQEIKAILFIYNKNILKRNLLTFEDLVNGFTQAKSFLLI